MNPLLLLRVLTTWEILTVSGLCMILIPLVSQLSTLRPRRRRIQSLPPAEQALMEAPGQQER